MGTIRHVSTSVWIIEVAIMRIIGNIDAAVENMDAQMNTYTEAAVVRIMRNIHAEVAHMDTARNIYTEVASSLCVERLLCF